MDWKSGPVYIHTDEGEVDHTEEIGGEQNIYVDYDRDGKVVGIEIVERYRIEIS